MSVGLFDADFFRYHQTIFNLELMKMSTYFKKKREITIMAPSFCPERYTHFFYQKDFNDGIFPKELNQYKNVTYGGFAFSNNNYVPLKEEIEMCIPDTSIYERYKDDFVEDTFTNEINFKTLTRGIHFRLSLNGKDIWKDFERQIPSSIKGRVFFVHDYNLNNIPFSAEYIQLIIQKYHISEKTTSSLCNKFPIICSNFIDFYKWLFFTFSSVNFTLQYNGMFTDEELVAIEKMINFSQSKKIIYNPFPEAFSKNDFLEEDLIKIFKQTLFLYNHQKQFLLKCNDNFLIPEEIKKMFNLFTAYGRSGNKRPTSLYYFVKELRPKKRYKVEIIDKPEAIDIFYYTQKNYPELFKLFYENSRVKYEGGIFHLGK